MSLFRRENNCSLINLREAKIYYLWNNNNKILQLKILYISNTYNVDIIFVYMFTQPLVYDK